MCTNTLSALEFDASTSKRAQYEAFDFELTAPGLVTVRNESYADADEHSYRVNVENSVPVACECPAEMYHDGACKHRIAVAIREPVLEAATEYENNQEPAVITDGGTTTERTVTCEQNGAGIGGVSLGWAFHQGPEFWVELYIDTSDKERNEAIYDALKQYQNEIHTNLADLDEELVWQRLPEKRACRIKCPCSIPNKLSELSTEERDQLVGWGVDTMDQFHDEFESRIADLAI